MFATPAKVTRAVSRWHVRSLEGSRRNALVASTALAERRRELVEVEEYLARHAAARAAGPTTVEVAVRSARPTG